MTKESLTERLSAARSAKDEFSVPLVNPHNPKAGVVLSTRQIFAGCGLGVQAYQRNVFDGDRPIAIKSCVRFVATAKKDDGYGSPTSPEECLRIELNEEQLLGIVGVLRRDRASTEIRLVRPNKPPKVLILRAQEGGTPFYFSLEQAGRKYATTFGYADSWGFQMVIVHTLRLLFPGLSDEVLLQSFARTARLSQGGA